MNRDIIVIGCSAGGFEELPKLISQFPKDLEASIFIVHHLEEGTDGEGFLRAVQKSTPLICSFPSHDDPIEYGHVYLAPPNYHMLVKEGKVLVIRGPRENRYRPSIDMLFRSAAAQYTNQVIGIVLTGMLDDGTSGLEAIKQSGGICIVQNPEDAKFPEMPLSAMRKIAIDHILSTKEMGKVVLQLLNDNSPDQYQEAPDYIKLEAKIAERFVLGLDVVSSLGQPAPYTCPDCSGALFQIDGTSLTRFRCHVGHSFTAAGMIKSHSQRMEEVLWVSLRLWEERLHMLLNMKETHKMKTSLNERLKEVQDNIEKIRGILAGNEIYD